MNILDRFFKYIKIPTNSSSNTGKHPSTEKQWNLAKVLVEDLKELGMTEVYLDEKYCYVYAILKGKENVKKIGFISHMDTSEAVTDENMNPQVIYNYDGENVNLNDREILDVITYPDLKNHIGKTLITTDGNTLLGADDKAGVAEIMTMLENVIKNDIPHGDIYVAFTPDEEIGEGAEFFDYDKFCPDIAYTVDGSDVGEIAYDNFNAASIKIEIIGNSVHLGSAKNILVNSISIANELINRIPSDRPENTDERQGYYHVDNINGDVSKTSIKMLIRDFEKDSFEERKNVISQIVNELNQKYNDCINIVISDTYYNMKNIISKDMTIIENVQKAIKNVGLTPISPVIRGGTDGAEISYHGLPCPNLGTGGHNFHSIYEYICLEDMEKSVQILEEIIKSYFESI